MHAATYNVRSIPVPINPAASVAPGPAGTVASVGPERDDGHMSLCFALAWLDYGRSMDGSFTSWLIKLDNYSCCSIYRLGLHA
jgi:hypothetical protein